MSAVAWPKSLPDRFLVRGYSENEGENVLRSEMDVGPAKTRLRATVAPVRVSASLVLTRDQFKTWQYFYREVLRYGTTPFLMKDITDTEREMYVVEPPQSQATEQYVTLSMTLEFIP